MINKTTLYLYCILLFSTAAHGMEPQSTEMSMPYSSYSSLHTAIDHKNHERVELLCRQKANIHQKDFLGKTPLLRAVEQQSTDIFFTLAKSGAYMDIHVPDYFGNYPINRAISYQKPLIRPIITSLLQLGANPNRAHPFTGDYPLHTLLYRTKDTEGPEYHNVYEVLKELIEHGANPNLPDRYGYTPLEQTHQLRHSKEIIRLLSKVTTPQPLSQWSIDPISVSDTPNKKYGCPCAIQ